MKIIDIKRVQHICGGEQTCTHGQNNLVKYDNGYIYGTILVPASQNGQILEVKLDVYENTLLGTINPFH